MTHKLYSVSISPIARGLLGSVNPINIDTQLSTVGDWIRFNTNQWFVWTDWSKADLVSKIQATVPTGDHFVVVALEPTFAQGQAPPWVWHWLNDKMLKQVSGS